MKIALEKNPQRKAALADTKAASADVKEARSFLLPQSDIFRNGHERQRSRVRIWQQIAAAAIHDGRFRTECAEYPDAIRQLRYALWRNLESVRFLRQLARRQPGRARQGRIRATAWSARTRKSFSAWWIPITACCWRKRQLEVAEQAVKTAQAILDRSKDRFDSGVVVESDYLSAQVRMAARKQELIRAQNNLALARAQLSTAIGMSAENEFDSSEALAEKNLPGDVAGRCGEAEPWNRALT